ncbi:recombinase family protein [Acetobacter pasteurianus]|uniref:recombinase family protein n=1 Tax=Acetobacter pasteurianus TaxID=438 RepID=UPI00350E4B22
MRGERVINNAQAVIVRRIFQDYAAGKSAKKIAVSLNEDHVPYPTGGAWGFSTITAIERAALVFEHAICTKGIT